MRAGAVLVRLGIEKAAARGKKSIRCAKEMKGWPPAFLLLLTLILLRWRYMRCPPWPPPRGSSQGEGDGTDAHSIHRDLVIALLHPTD